MELVFVEYPYIYRKEEQTLHSLGLIKGRTGKKRVCTHPLRLSCNGSKNVITIVFVYDLFVPSKYGTISDRQKGCFSQPAVRYGEKVND